MKWRQLLAVVLVLVVSFSAAGCSLINQAVQTAATASATTAASSSEATQATRAPNSKTSGETAVPTQESASSDSETTTDQVDTSSLKKLADMNSYHLVQSGKFTDVFSDSTSSVSTISIEDWEVKDPPASHSVYTSQKDAETPSTLEVYKIGADTYMKSSTSNDWVTMSTSDESSNSSFGEMGWFTDPSSVMNEQGKLIGVEDVNGVSAKHYLYTGDKVFAGLTSGTSEVSQADVWVSEKYNLVVKYSSKWQATDEDGTQHSWTFESEVSELDQPITINPPEGVAKPGVPEDVPIMEGATELSTFAGVANFKVTVSVDE
ncbi:MAG: hypothetical protein ACYC6L_17530, partial [Anaerolineae bacterium]